MKNLTSITQLSTLEDIYSLRLDSLDNLWFQVGGTICNLNCNHCFISCSPTNDKFKFLTLETVKKYLREAAELGVKEFYFTGGEPFLNKELIEIIQETLKIGPASVLTNGTLISKATARILRRLEDESIYSLEIRVSLDGFTPALNDKLRGQGSFMKAMVGISNLVDAGFLPIITAVQTWQEDKHQKMIVGFKQLLAKVGYLRPRIKLLPTINLGSEKERSGKQDEYDYISREMMKGYDKNLLLCSNSRIVASDGVYVCPLLIDFRSARLSDSLKENCDDFKLSFPTCATCYKYGAICSNYSTSARSE